MSKKIERIQLVKHFLRKPSEKNWMDLTRTLCQEAKSFDTKSMQLWPGGESVQIRGDVYSPGLLVKERTNAEINGVRGTKLARWKTPSPELLRKIKIEYLAERYQDQEILHCDSSLVDELLKKGFDTGAIEGFNYEEVTNVTADPSDWTLEQCKEWLEDNGYELPDPDPWKADRAELLDLLSVDEDDKEDAHNGMTDEQLREEVIGDIDAEDIDGLKDWRTAVQDNASEHQAEIYEWWRVTDWFGKELVSIDECVLDNGYGTWWGRCCTGQQFIMDGTLQKVAANHVKD